MRHRARGASALVRLVCGVLASGALVPAVAAAQTARLAEATQRQDFMTVAALLAEGVAVNQAQADGTTALHWAAHWNDRDTVVRLIGAGADPNARNRYGVAPLLLASENGNAAIIETLLAAGADPNTDSTGETPVAVASRAGRVDAVRALVEGGAAIDVTEAWRGQTALMWAAAGNHTDLVSYLVEAGAAVDAVSPGGFSPLLFAAREGALESARVLVGAGANIDDSLKNGSSALATAIRSLHYELASYLLGEGANPNAADETGATPLHTLIQARNPAAGAPLRLPTGTVDSLTLLARLLEADANPNGRTNEVPDRPTNERAILIDVGINLGGATPFLLAAKGADAPALRLLLAHGADPEVPTLQRVTPLMVASGVGFVESSDAGANTESELLETIALLLDLGADINASSLHGQTALHGGVYRGLDSILRFLAERGAGFDRADTYGRTPLVLAEQGFNNMGHYRREDQAALLRRLQPAP